MIVDTIFSPRVIANISAGKQLTLTATDNYNLTVPATGTVALLSTANVFSINQKINCNSMVALVVEQTGVKNNVWVVDTQNAKAGVNIAPIAAFGVFSVKNGTDQVATFSAGTGYGGADGVALVSLNEAGTLYKNITLAGTNIVLNAISGIYPVLIGTGVSHLRLGQKLEVATSATYGGMSTTTWSTTAAETNLLELCRSKSATIGTHTVVASGDALGIIYWRGSDGTQFISAASINGEVDGTPGTNDMPGRLIFKTTLDGASSTTERGRINNAGLWTIGNAGGGTSRFHIIGYTDIPQLSVTGYTTQATTTAMVQFIRNDTAAGVSQMLRLVALGSGSAGDGGSLNFAGKSSTTADTAMGYIDWRYIVATHASYTTAVRIYARDAAAARLGIEVQASGTVAMLGFYGHATAVQPAKASHNNWAAISDVTAALAEIGLVDVA